MRDAAVDRQLGAGRVGGVEGQERDSSRDLLSASESSHRVVRHHLRAGALDDVGGKGPFEDAGVDGAGADRVDADTAWQQLAGEGPRHRAQRGLAGRVDARQGQALDVATEVDITTAPPSTMSGASACTVK